jgi:hypothetical protein
MNNEVKGTRAIGNTAGHLNSNRSTSTRLLSRPLNTLESLKGRLLEKLLGAETNEELIRRLRRAADESASLAWASPFPLLTLPELLTEKVREAQCQFERQRAIQTRGRNVLQLAA